MWSRRSKKCVELAQGPGVNHYPMGQKPLQTNVNRNCLNGQDIPMQYKYPLKECGLGRRRASAGAAIAVLHVDLRAAPQ